MCVSGANVLFVYVAMCCPGAAGQSLLLGLHEHRALLLFAEVHKRTLSAQSNTGNHTHTHTHKQVCKYLCYMYLVCVCVRENTRGALLVCGLVNMKLK